MPDSKSSDNETKNSSRANTAPLTYASSGVNIAAGERVVSSVREMARATFTPQTLSDIGSFGALYDASFPDNTSPTLVSSADGVGTKLKVAFMAGVHDTVGEDLVNHCVNDILALGARPLFFMDYFATGDLDPEVAVQVVRGVARGCKNAGMALIGGETAEMPDIYAPGEYDLAGFIVGVVDRERIVDGSTIRSGDRLIGLASAGLHTNGYSLARRALFDKAGLKIDSQIEEVGATVGEALLRNHLCYLAAVMDSQTQAPYSYLHGMAHITGGGIAGNLSRIIPDGLQATVHKKSWSVPPLFEFIRHSGQIAESEMFHAFNMGVGYILALAEADVKTAIADCQRAGFTAWEMGQVDQVSSTKSTADKVLLV